MKSANDTMLKTRFGIEIEFTGISRAAAAKVAAEHLNGTAKRTYDSYDSYEIRTEDGRTWKVMSDSSIEPESATGRFDSRESEYRVELVSPILTYTADIETLQELARKLRKAGGKTNHSCGIHVHLDGADHTVRSIRNFINIIASKNDLFYKALQIGHERARFCRALDQRLIDTMNEKRPTTLKQIEDIWYAGYTYESRSTHYHSSRYHLLNLHSFFGGHHTVELRGFNSTLHAGKIRSYIVLALALNNQALTQKCASTKKPQTENEKFAMRTYLNRIGLIGSEYATCREHLTAALTGSAAWRHQVA